MPPPDPAQYDAFAGEYEAHAAVTPYNALYDRPATLRLLGDVEGLRVHALEEPFRWLPDGTIDVALCALA